jgi:hypothetical protein
MRVEFHPEAEQELIEAASYYELQVLAWARTSQPSSVYADLQRVFRCVAHRGGCPSEPTPWLLAIEGE